MGKKKAVERREAVQGLGRGSIACREVRGGLASTAHLSREEQAVLVEGHEATCAKSLPQRSTTNGKGSGAGAFLAVFEGQ